MSWSTSFETIGPRITAAPTPAQQYSVQVRVEQEMSNHNDRTSSTRSSTLVHEAERHAFDALPSPTPVSSLPAPPPSATGNGNQTNESVSILVDKRGAECPHTLQTCCASSINAGDGVSILHDTLPASGTTRNSCNSELASELAKCKLSRMPLPCDAQDEAEVEALLQQIALAKQKELRLRAEKSRIRDELGQLQAVGQGTLWSREEQTQKKLVEVRRAKELLETQKKTEEEKLVKLSDNLKEKELKFRKVANAKSSPFQYAAASVVTTATTLSQPNERSKQKENTTIRVQATNDVSPDKPMPVVNTLSQSLQDSQAQDCRHTATDKFIHLKPLDGPHQPSRLQALMHHQLPVPIQQKMYQQHHSPSHQYSPPRQTLFILRTSLCPVTPRAILYQPPRLFLTNSSHPQLCRCIRTESEFLHVFLAVPIQLHLRGSRHSHTRLEMFIHSSNHRSLCLISKRKPFDDWSEISKRNLEDLKERIQRRREEKKRELDHEDWVANQKRELVALRVQRAIQRNDVENNGQYLDILGESTESYNPESGFALFWDFVAGVPATANDLLVRLVTSVVQNGAGCPVIPMSLGWTAFGIFKPTSDGELALSLGFFKLPVKQSSMPDPSKILVLPPTPGECGDMRIHIRLVHGERVGEASQMLADPELHAGIQPCLLPDSGKAPPRPQSKSMMAGRRTPNDGRTPAKPLEDQKTRPPTSTIERLTDPPPSAGPQKQDFLDVDRLRLLSSASSRPPSTRPRSNIPPTGDKPRLPPFREDSNAEADEPWIRVDKTNELQRRLPGGNPFQSGDGVNVCIDGGRGFPDSVTISKVTIAALHADRTQVAAANSSAFAVPESDAFDPVFDAYVEYRQSNFNPTLTLVIRVETIELVSKRPVILGYSVFPVFLDVETSDQPNRPSIHQFILNEGGFQLPLHAQVQSAEANQSLSAKSCQEFPRIPCATVLLRIARATMAGDGLALLSRNDYPPSEWEAKGLLVPSPQYCDQFYDSLRCIPSGIEEKIYSIRAKDRSPVSSTDIAQHQRSSRYAEGQTSKLPRSLVSTPIRASNRVPSCSRCVAQRQGKRRTVLQSSLLRVSTWIILSSDSADRGVYFTTTTDWTSSQTSPEFGDGYTRSMKSCCVNQNILKGSTGGLSSLVDDIGSEKVKQLVPVAEPGASLFARLQDPQLPHSSSQPIVIRGRSPSLTLATVYHGSAFVPRKHRCSWKTLMMCSTRWRLCGWGRHKRPGRRSSGVARVDFPGLALHATARRLRGCGLCHSFDRVFARGAELASADAAVASSVGRRTVRMGAGPNRPCAGVASGLGAHGALPYAMGKLGLNAPVYGTLPVHRMGQIALYDAFQAKTKHDSDFSLFSLDDVDLVFERFKQLKYSEKLTLTSSGEGIVITPHVAGHLIGGALWRIMKETVRMELPTLSCWFLSDWLYILMQDDIIYAVDYNHRSEHVLQKTILDSFTRPTLLITDSMNLHAEQPKLKDRDSKIMMEILKTVRNGGNVLIPTDSSGRVLELMRVLDQYWIQNKLRDPIALLHDMSYYTPKAAQAMLEWCNDRIAKNFDVGRQNPFQFTHIHLVHTLEELDALPNPKVVLATSPSLECGFAKDIFIRWAPDPRNSIIFTSTTPETSFASRVLKLAKDPSAEKTITCSVTQKVFLEGAELALYEVKERKRLRTEAENKAKEIEEAAMEDMMMGIEDFESESEEEETAQQEGELWTAGRFGAIRIGSVSHVLAVEPKVEWDEYGEIINPDDFKDATLLANRQARRNIIEDADGDEDMENADQEAAVETRPTKTIINEVVVNIAARITQVDFDGIADGRAIRNCLGNVKPRKLILVHGTEKTTNELKQFVESSIPMCEAVFTPNVMECIDIESDTNVYKLSVKESLYTSAVFRKVGSHEVAYVTGQLVLPENSSVPVLQPLNENGGQTTHEPILLSDGKMKLDVMKQVLGKAGFQAKFRGARRLHQPHPPLARLHHLHGRIPTTLQIDVNGLHVGDKVYLESIKFPEGVVPNIPEGSLVAKIAGRRGLIPRVEAVVEEVVEQKEEEDDDEEFDDWNDIF
ncbi:Cleavage and polyadenylation specificity factor subunit 2 [Phytophthora cactorum]|nr:Cleavage and polyadenylation specificity factor subunit 2 [Phytophthora cactorum]